MSAERTVTGVMEEALREIAEQQPKVLAGFRRLGIVFDDSPGTDPKNWQHVAFDIYRTLCHVDWLARSALASIEEEQP